MGARICRKPVAAESVRANLACYEGAALEEVELEAEGRGAEVGGDVARMRATMKRTPWMLAGNLRDQLQRLHVRRS